MPGWVRQGQEYQGKQAWTLKVQVWCGGGGHLPLSEMLEICVVRAESPGPGAEELWAGLQEEVKLKWRTERRMGISPQREKEEKRKAHPGRSPSEPSLPLTQH